MDRYTIRGFAMWLILIFGPNATPSATAQPISTFEAEITTTVNGESVRKGIALVTLEGNELRILGTIFQLNIPWLQADIYSGDPDDGGELISNLVIRIPDPQALAGGFDHTVVLTEAQVEALQQNEVFVSISVSSPDPQLARLKGRVMSKEAPALSPVETPLSGFLGGWPVARGGIRAIPSDTTLRLVGFFNGLGSNWQQIVISKGPAGGELEHVQTLHNFFGSGLYLGFDYNLDIGSAWQGDLLNGLFHIRIATSRETDALVGRLLPMGNTAPPAPTITGPANGSTFLVGGTGGEDPVDPLEPLGVVSVSPVVDPDGQPVSYIFQFSHREDFNPGSGTVNIEAGVDAANLPLTVESGASIFDAFFAEGTPIPLDTPRTLHIRAVTTDGSRFTIGEPVQVTFIRGLITSTESETERPQAFRLHGNYPNPFNPSTTIMFDLNAPADVTLEVYDVLGKMVLTQSSGPIPAGSDHRIDLNASALSSGTYVYRVLARTGSDTAVGTGRMLLLK